MNELLEHDSAPRSSQVSLVVNVKHWAISAVCGLAIIAPAPCIAGSFPTPYVPTTTASATRAKDLMTLPWNSAPQGTIYGKAVIGSGGPISQERIVGSNTAISPLFWATPTTFAAWNGSVELDKSGFSLVAGNTVKAAISWNSGGRSLTANGAAAASDAGAIGSFTTLQIGAGQNSNQWNGNIQSVIQYAQPKDVQALTK